MELHPGIGAEVGYDSNIFYSDQDPLGAAILRITPHLLLSTLGPERRGDSDRAGTPPTIQFRGGASASYYIFFTDEAKDNLEGDLDLALTILPQRPVSITLTENFSRGIRPFTEQGALASNYRRLQNTAGIRFNFANSGNIFTGNLGYNASVDIYEGESFSFTNNLTHSITGGVSYRFLPQTALIYDAQLQMTGYISDETGSVLLSDNERFRTRVGLNGAITQQISFLGLVGYSAGFYDDDRLDDFESVAAQLELRWSISETSRLSVGYDRNFQNSFVGGSYRADRGYANFQVLLSGVFMLGLDGSVGYYDFGRTLGSTGMPLGEDGTTERSDIRVTAHLFGEYRVADWLGFNATLGYAGDFTDFAYTRLVGMAVVPDPAKYNKFEGWFGVRAFY